MSRRPELLELLLSPLSATPNQFKVTVTQSPAGEGSAESDLPFVEAGQDWRSTLIRSLELSSFQPEYFTAPEQAWMVKAQLLAENALVFHPHCRQMIGQVLYRALIPPQSKVERLLNESIQIAKTRGVQLLVQLKFEEDAVQIARLPDYPWELIHDGTGFLLHNQVGFSRYIAFPAVPPSLSAVEQVNVLLISSGASDRSLGFNPLPKKERSTIAESLKAAIGSQRIRLEELPQPTLDELAAYLTQHSGKEAPHLLHFDGHGLLGKQCSECRRMHKGTKAQQCKRCSTPLPDAQGYLLFEDEYGDPDYISASQLGTLLQQTRQSDGTHQTGGVAALVLSACQSGMAIEGESVFQGTAQNLIYHGVPAVVAMQYSVSVEGAIAFAKQFYQSIGEKNSLAVAVSQGRAMMRVDQNQWYRPVLYLRWRDNEGGQLFAEEKPTSQLRIGVPLQAPLLPSYYVDRPEVSQDLKARLLQPTNGATKAALMITAIHGLGAIGKSTLATALAHDPEIQAHFADGILWATLGQQPNLLSWLGSWIQALGDHNFQGTTVEASMTHLRTLLQEKVALLVVDDAWDSSHVQAFLVGGTKCQVLITSRDKLIATSVGATLYSLDVMSREQSLQLLAKRLGRNLTAGEQPQAEELAEEVGYLPLALELAAVQVADGITWTELLQDLRAEVAYLEALDLVGSDDVTDEASSKRMSLRKSLTLSIRRLTNERRQQFAWFGVLPEDVSITPAMAVTLWNLSSATAAGRKARDTLRYLRDKAIVLDGVPLADGTATYRLHDMFHDLAKNLLTASPTVDTDGQLAGLGLKRPQAHGELLHRYRQKTQQQQWHTLPNDGYIHERLIWHLEQAGWQAEIHALLGETAASGRNGWYKARERLGQTAGYISDLRRAAALAYEAAQTALSPEVMGWQCRYALIAASLNSVAAIPGELLVALVKKGVWMPEQGLAYARQVTDPKTKATNLMLLADELPDSLQPTALHEALEAAQAIGDEYDRFATLFAFADQLPEVLPQALDAAQVVKSEYSRFQALSALANKLPELMPQALDAAQAIGNEASRLKALAALAAKLPPELMPQALDAAQAIENEWCRSSALAALAAKLPPELMPQALKAAQAIGHETSRLQALAALAAKLPELMPQALKAAQTVKSEYSRSSALAALAAKLPPELMPQALNTAQAIEDAWARSSALAALADKLPEVLPRALEAAKAIHHASFRVPALATLADKLPEVLPQALDAAQLIGSESDRSKALGDLAAKLPPELMPQALKAAQAIGDERYRSLALGYLADKLPLELMPQALDAAQAIGDKRYRSLALGDLADKLPPELIPQALDAAQVIGDESVRSEALGDLATKWPELLPQALEAAQTIRDEAARFDALVALAQKLPEVLPQALDAAQAFKSLSDRLCALGSLVSKLPLELFPQALEAAQAIRDERYRSWTLATLTAKLQELLPQALDAAEAIEDASAQSASLVALADKLPEVLPQALDAAQAIEDEWCRSSALAALAAKLPPALLPQALDTAQAIEDERCRSSALAALAAKLPPALLPQAFAAAQVIEDASDRFDVLVALADKLPEVLPQAFAAAQALWNEDLRSRALAALADKLTPEVLPQAFAAAQVMEDASDRLNALISLADKLPPALLPQALETAPAIGDGSARYFALIAFLPKLVRLSSVECQQCWCKAVEWLALLPRPEALRCWASLTPVIFNLGGKEAIAAVAKAIDEVCHWWR